MSKLAVAHGAWMASNGDVWESMDAGANVDVSVDTRRDEQVDLPGASGAPVTVVRACGVRAAGPDDGDVVDAEDLDDDLDDEDLDDDDDDDADDDDDLDEFEDDELDDDEDDDDEADEIDFTEDRYGRIPGEEDTDG